VRPGTTPVIEVSRPTSPSGSPAHRLTTRLDRQAGL